MKLLDLPAITHLDPSNTEFDFHATTKQFFYKYVHDEKMFMIFVIPDNHDCGIAGGLQIAQSFEKGLQRNIVFIED